jgi:hypothetical protein
VRGAPRQEDTNIIMTTKKIEKMKRLDIFDVVMRLLDLTDILFVAGVGI